MMNWKDPKVGRRTFYTSIIYTFYYWSGRKFRNTTLDLFDHIFFINLITDGISNFSTASRIFMYIALSVSRTRGETVCRFPP